MEFVSFELAKKLKEKGFKKECLRYYDTKDVDKDYFHWSANESAIANAFYHSWNTDNEGFKHERIDAPTISQVLKWLREEKNIDIDITVHPSFATTTKKVYAWRVVMDSDGMECKYKDGIHTYGKYEQAALAGIEYTLDHLL